MSKNEKLSTTVSVSSTYSGEFAGEYISAMLLKAKTLADNLITIKPNVSYKMVVKKGLFSGTIAGENCDFTPSNSITLTERILEPKKLEYSTQICKNSFSTDWEAIQMGYSAWKNTPPKLQDWLIDQMSTQVASQIETMIWQGAADTTASFSGFTKLFAADSTVVDVSGTTITAANVQAELAKVVAAGAALNTYGTEQVIYAGQSVIANYLISLGGFGASGLGANGFKSEGPTGVQNAPLMFGGVKIVLAPGMPANQMVLANPENLWFGTGLMSDYQEVKVSDTSDLLLDDYVRMRMKFTAGIQYGVGSEIVYYWIY